MFYVMPLNWDLSDDFLMIRLGSYISTWTHENIQLIYIPILLIFLCSENEFSYITKYAKIKFS